MINWLEFILIAVLVGVGLAAVWLGVVSLIAYRVFDFLRSETPFDVIIRGKENDQK
jgi:hypothetical protein